MLIGATPLLNLAYADLNFFCAIMRTYGSVLYVFLNVLYVLSLLPPCVSPLTALYHSHSHYIYQLKQDNIYTINKPPKSMLYLQITNNGDKNDMVSQMAHAKNLGEPFMAHLENLYNIP